MDVLNNIVGKINTYLTDYVLLFLLVGNHCPYNHCHELQKPQMESAN